MLPVNPHGWGKLLALNVKCMFTCNIAEKVAEAKLGVMLKFLGQKRRVSHIYNVHAYELKIVLIV